MAALLSVGVAHAQQKAPTPLSPAADGPPVWSRTLQMPDGRTFVTDGGLAIDAAFAKPATLPSLAQPGAIVARSFTATPDEQIGLGDLGTGPFANTFATPKGVVLNGNYVKYLRTVLSGKRVRLHAKGGMDPVVVVLDGTPVAVLMPVRR